MQILFLMKKDLFIGDILKKMILDDRLKKYDVLEAHGFSEKKFDLLKRSSHFRN